MKNMLSIKSGKYGFASFILIIALAFVNAFPVFASEVTEYDINKEISEREALGAEISVFRDVNGNIMGYLGLYDVSAGTSNFPSNTITTNGWNGTFSPAYSGNFQK